MIKYGLKMWSSNHETIDQAKELIKTKVFDYIELLPVPDIDISPFQKIEASFVIHIPHSSFGFNIADKKKEEFNLKIINHSIKCADKLNAKYLVLHPGFGSFNTAKKFLEKTEGASPEQVTELIEESFLKNYVGLSDNQIFRNRFRAEAKVSAKLTHPNIVTAYDFGLDSKRLFIVMELVNGTHTASAFGNIFPCRSRIITRRR